ncbi:universal stress protein [Natronococcus occultus]|uniref:Universal stress protein UspA-like protein n=1 Tax=Natronococcus occultus SP4 TaxID=694430 RepID=L0K104_9EURY|nr:universal stress protein [Natronococcus occultus]AGB38681.1 universal stress protein UspA-like protein [Natronococcus occultus SP4]
MTVVAAVDSGTGARTVAEAAATLADRSDVPLDVLSVYEESEHEHLVNQALDTGGSLSDEDRLRIATTAAENAAADLDREYDALGRHGKPTVEILEHASDVDAEYIVIGGRQRSPVGKALFGSVTQSVLLEADRPVVVVPEPPEES